MAWKTGAVALVAALLATTPALAQAQGQTRSGGGGVKAGVDAWTRGDYKTAVDQWRAPAIAGDADAQFNMGQAYKLGRGVPAADLATAAEWYRKAALQGHLQAGDNYGLALFQDGRRADALPWLEKSAARDEKRAELVLGTMLFNGDGVPKDWVRAYALVSRSSQQGLEQGSRTLAQLDGFVTADQRQQGIAMANAIEANGRSQAAAQVASVPPGIRQVPVPASTAVDTTPMPAPVAPLAARPPHPRQSAPIAAQNPPPRPTPHPAPVAVASAAGSWRIQLGAFRDQGNAEAQWRRVAGRLGGARADYQRVGGITRLQAGPFGSKADAERACAAAKGAGAACIVAGR